MSEFSVPPNNSSKKTQFSSLLLSHLLLFFSFILSHPLYFFYFIFFSPYILKTLSFLSPLFITTFLLLLALFTTFINGNPNCPESSELKPSFLLTAYHNILEKLRSSAGDEDHQEEFRKFEELEAYKIVFEAESRLELLEQQGSSSSSMEEEPVDKHPSHESYASDVNESLADQIMQSETLQLIDGEKRVEGSLKENDDGDGDLSVDLKGEKVVKPPSVESYKGEETSMKSGSNAIIGDHNGVVEYLSKVRSNSQRLGSENGGGEQSSKSMEKSQLSGSMRKEKEWKRTLACKLFEERHRHTSISSSVNVEGGAEEMDLLWETYESTDSNKSKTKKRNEEDEDEEEEDEEEMEEGRLCCLQALKFSAGKMNLGMRRPNLVKISKAIKGFGWLHHVTTKHGNRKVYP